MECLVTGGSGFIGRALCRELIAAGVKPQLAGRNSDCDVFLDLEEPLPEALGLSGIDVLFHLAGIAHRDAPAAQHERVNHQATIALARAAAAAGVGHFVYVSSVRALGDGVGDRSPPRGESDAAAPGEAYGLAKHRAELALADLADRTKLRVTVLRPPLVYGPGASANLGQLRRWVRLGLPLPPDVGGRSMISRDDLASVLLSVARSGGSGCTVWNVTDGEVYSARRLCLAMARAGRGDRYRPDLPLSLWRWLCWCRDRLSGGAPGSTYRALFGWDVYSDEALRAALDWRPAQRFEDVAGDIVAGGVAL